MPIFLYPMIKVVPFIYEDYDELYANTYVLIDENKCCVVIDPAKDYPGIVNYINKNKLTLKAVLLTHGHADHMRGTDTLIKTFNCPLYIGFDDEDKLTDKFANCSMYLGEDIIVNSKAITVADKEAIHLLSEDIIAIHTPFHTSGSICYYLKESNVIFTGDFIFKNAIGRADLPSAMPHMLYSSVNKLRELHANPRLYPGHGGFSKLEDELDYLKQNNF